MIGPWEILLKFNRDPKDEGIHLGRNVACAIAQDIEKICADYEAQQAALSTAAKVLQEEAENAMGERATKIDNALAKIRGGQRD